jgi:hypothetical protein
VFGATGYIIFQLADDKTAVDNIISPYPVGDTLLLIGRSFLALALLTAFPVIMVPCRTIVLNEIMSFIQKSKTIHFGLKSPLPVRACVKLATTSSSNMPNIHQHYDEESLSDCEEDEVWYARNYNIENSEMALLRHLTDDVDVGLEGLEPTWQAWRARHAILTYECDDGAGMDFQHGREQEQRYGDEKNDLRTDKHNHRSVQPLMVSESTPLLPELQVNPVPFRAPGPCTLHEIRRGSYYMPRLELDSSDSLSQRKILLHGEESPLPMVVYSSIQSKLAATLVLNLLIIIVAVEIPQVSIVWTLAGSSVSLFVGFVMPTIAYIKFCHLMQLHYHREMWIAWALLLYAISIAVVCTIHNAFRISRGEDVPSM